jgi:preprotein translocase subunit SecD
MASNEDLIKTITEAVEALGVEMPETKGKNNKELAEIAKAMSTAKLVKMISDKANEAGVEMPDTDGKTNQELGAVLKSIGLQHARQEQTVRNEKAEKPKKPPYEVAKGKSLTTKTGVKIEGDPISVQDLAGGEATMKRLVDKKYVKKN